MKEQTWLLFSSYKFLNFLVVNSFFQFSFKICTKRCFACIQWRIKILKKINWKENDFLGTPCIITIGCDTLNVCLTFPCNLSYVIWNENEWSVTACYWYIWNIVRNRKVILLDYDIWNEKKWTGIEHCTY